MPAMNDRKTVEKQYANADGLNVRIALHHKYSVNQQPFGDWIASHYCIRPGERVLELGCGTGGMWAEPDKYLPPEATLLLTDYSQGMLETARSTVPPRSNIVFAQADIQAIPYGRNTFDLVIANAMLYHVPDLDRALSEVARVLKPDGRFICSTSGQKNVGSWLVDVLGADDTRILPFSLQNGADALERHFDHVEMHMRDDALEVTNADDLADYVLSMASFSFVRAWPREQLKALLNQQKVDGIIHIPKEYGLFICKLPQANEDF